MTPGFAPKSWAAMGCSSSSKYKYRSVFFALRVIPSELVNSVISSPQPPSPRITRRNSVSVTPAMGANTVAGCIVRSRILYSDGIMGIANRASLADWKWDIRYQRSDMRNRLCEARVPDTGPVPGSWVWVLQVRFSTWVLGFSPFYKFHCPCRVPQTRSLCLGLDCPLGTSIPRSASGDPSAGHTPPSALTPRAPTFQVLAGLPVSLFSFKNSSSRKNFLPSAPLYADHSGSPESLASAARTAASLESMSSK